MLKLRNVWELNDAAYKERYMRLAKEHVDA